MHALYQLSASAREVTLRWIMLAASDKRFSFVFITADVSRLLSCTTALIIRSLRWQDISALWRCGLIIHAWRTTESYSDADSVYNSQLYKAPLHSTVSLQLPLCCKVLTLPVWGGWAAETWAMSAVYFTFYSKGSTRRRIMNNLKCLRCVRDFCLNGAGFQTEQQNLALLPVTPASCGQDSTFLSVCYTTRAAVWKDGLHMSQRKRALACCCVIGHLGRVGWLERSYRWPTNNLAIGILLYFRQKPIIVLEDSPLPNNLGIIIVYHPTPSARLVGGEVHQFTTSDYSLCGFSAMLLHANTNNTPLPQILNKSRIEKNWNECIKKT